MLNGALADVRIYNAGLSAADLAAMAALGPNQMLSTNPPQMGLALTGTNLTIGVAGGEPGLYRANLHQSHAGRLGDVTAPAPQIVGGNWQVALPPATNAGPVFYRLTQ